jgi:DNA repair exonuclease SbcCD nuclease subunit
MAKVLIFSDIHWGLNLNSQTKLNIAIQDINFLIETARQKQCDYCIFCGDWYHDRKTIAVNVSDESYRQLKRLSEVIPNKIQFIIGNHDTYFKNSISVNSVNVFENLVDVISQPKTLIIGNKTLAFLPWGENIKEINIKANYLFGHFEPNGAQLCGTTSQNRPYDMEDLNRIAPLVFSGHFHYMTSYETDLGKVIMVGSPSQQNWGDVDNKRGCYILDTETGYYEFIENINAPKHIKYSYASLLKTKKLPPKSEISGNIIKLIVDCKYKFEDIHKLLDIFNKASPLIIEQPEYYFNNDIQLVFESGEKEKKFKTNEEHIENYILNVEGIDSSVNRQKLLELAKELYNLTFV